jgi:hypothetical protein
MARITALELKVLFLFHQTAGVLLLGDKHQIKKYGAYHAVRSTTLMQDILQNRSQKATSFSGSHNQIYRSWFVILAFPNF